MGRYRGEDVTAVKGAGDGMQVKAFLGERTSTRDATQRLCRRNEQPVVRTDQQGPAFCPESQLPSLRADSRIYHRQIYRVGGHVAGGVLQDLSSRLYLETRYLVRQINDGQTRRNPQHHTLARADEVVG